MKTLLALLVSALTVVSMHDYYQCQKTKEANETAERVALISERMVSTNKSLFKMATECARTMGEQTLGLQARALMTIDEKDNIQKFKQYQTKRKTRLALNATAGADGH